MKCRAEAIVTNPAMVYIVLLYRKGLEIILKIVRFKMSLDLPWVNCSRRHDGHEFGNCQCLGLYQGARL